MKKENASGRADRKPRRRAPRYDQRSGLRRAVELALAALAVTLLVEGFNQGSVLRMLKYLTGHIAYFGINYLIVLTTLSFTELVKHRRALSWTLAGAWVLLGFANYMVCRDRTQPLIISDLLLTREVFGLITVYFTWPQIIAMSVGALALIVGVIFLFSRTRKYKRVKYGWAVGSSAAMLCLTLCVSLLAIQGGLVPKYFSDRVQAYHDYGFSTCFAFTIGSSGINRPDSYSSQSVSEILDEITEPEATQAPVTQPRFDAGDQLDRPNLVFIQLESFLDVDSVIGASFSADPMPNFHKLLKSWPNGELYVPTIGGGTANVEFEVMAGMNMDFFGAGDTPYNTIMQEETCETIASTLRDYGYVSSALHNNTGTFFSRNEVYANLGFDRFDPIEYMLYPSYNDVGWAQDTVLTDEIMRIMENSSQRDMIFAISVESHGKYSEVYEYKDGDIEVRALPEDAYYASFQNYINIIRDVDRYVGQIIQALSAYDEPVIAILYGDHLPALGLTSEMLDTGDLYASRYVIWNNFGADIDAPDMQAYRLSAYLLGQLGISDGVMTRFHQAYAIDETGEKYLDKLQTLEYDLLYGDREAYGDEGAPERTDLALGVDPIVISDVDLRYGRMLVSGENFTGYSKIICGEEILDTIFVSARQLAVAMPAGTQLSADAICVAQINADGKELGRTAEFALK